MKNSKNVLRSAALAAAVATLGWTGSANALPCLQEAFGPADTLNCTSNDIKIASITVAQVIEACDGSEGDTFTFSGTLDVTPSAQTRYDIGFYIGGDPLNSLNDDCSVSIIPPADGVPDTNADGDSCGDTTSSAPVQIPVTNITAPCQDGDGDFFFDVNTCSSWRNSADPADCADNGDAIPENKSKCNCEVVPTNLEVPYCDTNADCDDGNLCTTDVCNAQGSGLGDLFGCSHSNNTVPCEDGIFCNGDDTCSGGACNGHSGDPCAEGGVCGDQCNEDADNCFVAAGTVCRASAGVCDTAEECTGSSEDCPDDAFQNGTTCRASAGVCDVAETCNGSSASCPADGFNEGNTCRASAGVCDVAETCQGDSANCPADGFQEGNTCRASAGVCDVAETCQGDSADCPADGFQASTVTCRADAGECDVAEACTGSSAACPADGFEPAGTGCSADDNLCTKDECDGNGTCEHGANSETCDDGIFCNGADTCVDGSCSGHAGDPCVGGGVCGDSCNEEADNCFDPSTTVCREANGVCDVAENCTGSSADCPADGFSEGNTCRASAGVCDVAETCNGSSANCPADAFQNGTTCRASAGVCDVAETCNGQSANCPADGFLGTTTVCRADAGDCDVAERCTGASAACPANGFEQSGTACTSDGNVCTNDTCNGSGTCQHPNNTVACDDGQFCTVNDTCANGQCNGSPRQCGDEFSCTIDSCNEQIDACVADPQNDRCADDDICTTDICDAEVGCRHVFSCKDICRRPGFWAKRAGNEGSEGSLNVTQELLDAVGGVEACGQEINSTNVGEEIGLESALEGLCVHAGDSEERYLYRELVATALNCAMSGAPGAEFCDSVVSEFIEVSFSTCSAACAGELEISEDSEGETILERCARELDCYNSGGRIIDGRCALGICDVTDELCGAEYGVCPPTSVVTVPVLQVCERFDDNCRDEPFCQDGLGICPSRLPATSKRACKDAKRNTCTIDDCTVFDGND